MLFLNPNFCANFVAALEPITPAAPNPADAKYGIAGANIAILLYIYTRYYFKKLRLLVFLQM